jgi:hypothetical protein
MRYFVVLFFLLLFGGCDLFQTRDAQQPNQSRSNFQSAVTHDLVIQNLVNSMKDKNSRNYLACFSDTSFLFLPSSGAASLYPSFATSWDKPKEDSYFRSLIGNTWFPENLEMTLDITFLDSSQQGNSFIYTASYILTVPFTTLSIPSIYQGNLKFYMKQDSQIWSIYLWEDNKNTNLPSWSDLKGRMY